MTRKQQKRFTKTEKVGPKRARALLATMKTNRKVTRTVVIDYARQMREGMWRSTSQGLIIDWDGHLMNGQHRLLAVIESGVTIEVDITYGEDPDNFMVLDKHRKRDLSDALSIAGIEYPNETSRLYRVYLDLIQTKDDRYIAFGARTRWGWKPERAIEWAKENRARLVHVIHVCKGPQAKKVLRPPAVMMALYYRLHEIDEEQADAFFKQLVDGCKTGPVGKLREALDGLMLQRVQGTIPPRYMWPALVIKAWNAYVNGKRLRQLEFDGGYEPFPDILEVA
jgi:hypothetical protein